MKIDKKVSFISYLIRYFIIILSLSSIVVTVSIILFSNYQFKENIESTKIDYLEYQKELTKSKVMDVIENINFAVSESSNKAKKIVKYQTDMAVKVAKNILAKNIKLYGEKDVRHIIKESLREIRYNDGRGYLFVIDLKGNEILNGDRPDLEDKNLLRYPDEKVVKVVHDMIEIAKEKGEGFYTYKWTKPGKSGNDFTKISYVKLIPELGWIVGTGEYLEDIIEDAKKDVLSKAGKIRFGKSGYVFMFDFNGIYLAHIKTELVGKTRFWYVDKDGVNVGEELLKLSLMPDGGFLSYYWLRGQNEYVKKIAYAKAYPEWKWVICAGLFEDEVSEIINNKSVEFNESLSRQLFFILFIVLSILSLFYVFTYFYARLLRKDKNKILSLIQDNAEINTLNFKFSEFENIAEQIIKYKSEIHEMKELLFKKNEEYKNLIEFLPLPVTITADEKFVFINKEAEKLLNIKKEDVEKYSPDFFVYSDKSCYKALINSKENIVNRTLFVRNLNGDIIEVDVTSTEVVYEGMNASLCIFKDITEIKTAYEQIKKDKELIYNVLENISDAVIVMDKDYNITMLNSYAKELSSNNNCQYFYDCFKIYEDEKMMSEQIVKSAYSDEDLSWILGKTFLLKGKHELIVSISLSRIYNKNGEVDTVVAVLRDLTEVINNERTINQISRIESLGQLAGGIAHNFNNVLAAVLNSIEIIKLHLNDKPELLSLVGDVKETVNKAKSITNQLITFSKGGEPVKTNFNINKTLSEVLKVVLSGQSVITKINLYYKPLFVFGDEGQISQVIQNILINALHAIDKENGIIRVFTRYTELKNDTLVGDIFVKKGRYAEIIIEDNGAGIDDNIKGKIFDAYFTTKQNGTGLGLSSSLNIVNKHSGFITFKSKVNIGTTFTLYLPISESDGLYDVELREDLFVAFNGILIMDDEKIVRNSLAIMLKDFSKRIFQSSDGREAITILEENKDIIDVAVVDLTVPGGMGGAECVKVLKDLKPELLCIVSSGYSEDPVLANFRDYGFDAVLPKPYTLESLKKLLCQLTRKC
jgi:PAS domain S-box-containing protein